MKIRSKMHPKEWYSTGYYSIFQMFRIGIASQKHPFRLHERGAFTKKGRRSKCCNTPIFNLVYRYQQR